MKNTIKLALVAAMAMGATSAFATNGDLLIGLGAQSRAMGGTGIAQFMGAESGLSNPALISKQQGTEISFGGTYFHPSVNYDNGVESTSQAKHNMIPEVSIASELGDGWAVGVGMFGSAGMGTDYMGADAAFSMRTNLQLMKFGVPIAYGQDGWSIGIAPVLQYGALAIAVNSAPPGQPTGPGVSQDFGIGYEAGVSYDVDGFTVGAVYKSAISMNYDAQISDALTAFGMSGAMSDTLEQPAEIGLGVAYTMDDLTVTADYRRVKWGSAEGYQDFNWKDQNVYAIGAEYRMDDLALRIGFNHAKSPIEIYRGLGATNTGPGTDGIYEAAALNTFNLLGFPAITENHVTIGTGIAISKTVSLDLAYVYGWTGGETGETIVGAGANGATEVDNDQDSVTAMLKFNF